MSEEPPRPPRRKRYSGKNPRRFDEKYKEHDPARHAETIAKVLASGKTPAGSHVPILVRRDKTTTRWGCVARSRIGTGVTARNPEQLPPM